MSRDGKFAHGGGNLGYLLKRAQLAFRARMDEALKPLGITAPQYAVLSSLFIEPGISSAALARVAFVTPQSMQGIVANLEKLNLIQRAADPGHGRILQSHLTERGKAVLARAHKSANAVETAMAGGIAARDLTLFKSLLMRAAENLGG
ncbi:MAG TPA: MarR family transcriptional regulator [Rhizomicrobium sp.]|jgi:DNA-binding MarR family transcriptional regulator|nr:MarR family transcriptional regulator [Rhizomicrobium sp.]